LPDGKIAGRYDKRIPLSFIEQPAAGIIFPFLSSEGFVVKRGENNEPLNTPYGKAGVMICNESSVPSAASSVAKNGAQFLVNISNDGWFNNTYLVNLHFYNVRMRAVETRKDIVVNSNTGISGLVKASGEIAIQERSDEPYVKTLSIIPNNIVTPAVIMPLLLVYVCLACILFFAAKSVMNKSNKTKAVEHTSKLRSSSIRQKPIKKKKLSQASTAATGKKSWKKNFS
jgi:apolipoprotein N-acyltransferase